MTARVEQRGYRAVCEEDGWEGAVRAQWIMASIDRVEHDWQEHGVPPPPVQWPL